MKTARKIAADKLFAMAITKGFSFTNEYSELPRLTGSDIEKALKGTKSTLHSLLSDPCEDHIRLVKLNRNWHGQYAIIKGLGK